MRRLLIVALLLGQLSAAENWQQALVRSVSREPQERGRVNGPSGSNRIDAPIMMNQMTIVFVGQGHAYHCFEIVGGGKRLPILAERTIVKIRVNRGDLTFLDQAGYKHKATILSIHDDTEEITPDDTKETVKPRR